LKICQIEVIEAPSDFDNINYNPMTSINNPSTTSNRSEGIVFQTEKDLIDIFDTEFKKTPDGLVFEQGGFLTKVPRAGSCCTEKDRPAQGEQ
jgi:hypothetical protein